MRRFCLVCQHFFFTVFARLRPRPLAGCRRASRSNADERERAMPILKDLKIKTNSVIRHAAAPPHSPVSAPSNHHCSCGRMQKDLGATAKEIARQEKRIQEYKDDPTREPEDVKKQEEVLAEYLAGRTDEKNRLGEFAETLSKFMVSPARQPSSRAARALHTAPNVTPPPS